MLIDTYLPAFDVSERHEIRVTAPAERIYAALRSADLAAHPVVRLLLACRALPAAVLNPRTGLQLFRTRARASIRLREFEAHGFTILDEKAPHEILIGLEGRFWRVRGGLCAVDRASFQRPLPPGTARAAWNFHVDRRPDGTCTLSTETRVRCADRSSRLRFRFYWLVVRPGSGLIRRLMLRSIRTAAETPDAPYT